MTLDDLGWP